MKLAIFTTHPIQYQSPWFRSLASQAGLEVRVHYFIVPDSQAQGSGFDVLFQWDVPLREGFENREIQSIRFSSSTSKFFTQIATDLVASLREFAPDAILVLGWNNVGLVQANLTARLLGIPVIMRGESNDKRHRARWVSAIHRAFVARSDAFLTVGQSNRDFYRRLGVGDDRIFMAPYFVDNSRFAAEAEMHSAERMSLRRAWKIPDEAFCVLFAGKLEEKKRVSDFLNAIEIAHGRGVPLHALVVGSGADMASAKALVADRGLPVTFAGFLNQTEISRAYVAADALVLPSDFGETWGLVCNEAMVCGTPAIVSQRVGCADDLVLDGETGAVVPFADPAAIADVLELWAHEPELHAGIAQRARAHVTSHYSIERANEALVQAIQMVASQ